MSKVPKGLTGKSAEAWKENSGCWADPEKAAEAGRKSGARRRANRQMREILSNPDGFREEAMTAILEKYPDALDKLAQTIYDEALSGDKQAMQMAVKLFGMEAPKKTETTVKEHMDADRAKEVLMRAQAEGES